MYNNSSLDPLHGESRARRFQGSPNSPRHAMRTNYALAAASSVSIPSTRLDRSSTPLCLLSTPRPAARCDSSTV